MLDEHYYTSASWFAQNSTHYDSYSRNGPKIFVGEYAVAYAIPPGTFPATLQNAHGRGGVDDRIGTQLGHCANGLLRAVVLQLEQSELVLRI